jgi:hypothetical protein
LSDSARAIRPWKNVVRARFASTNDWNVRDVRGCACALAFSKLSASRSGAATPHRAPRQQAQRLRLQEHRCHAVVSRS